MWTEVEVFFQLPLCQLVLVYIRQQSVDLVVEVLIGLPELPQENNRLLSGGHVDFHHLAFRSSFDGSVEISDLFQ